MLEKIIEDIKREQSYNFEKIIETTTLNDEEFFKLLKFIYLENIPEVRTSLDGKDFIVLDDDELYSSEKETIKEYLNEIKEKNKNIDESKNKKNIEESQEKFDKYLKIAVKESLVYSKYGFSFLDLVQESSLGLITAINYYDRITEITKEYEFFMKNFSAKYILEFQKKYLKDIEATELSYMLYLKYKIDLELGKTIDEICKQMGVTKDYILELEKLFDNVEIEELIENEEILNRAEKITKRYLLENIPKKLSYIDEQILIMSYGLDDKVYTEKEISKILNISQHNVNILKEKALSKLSIDLINTNEMYENDTIDYSIN